MRISRAGVNLMWWLFWAVVTGLVLADVASARAGALDTTGAIQLRAKYVALQDQLADSPFQRPLALDSSQSPGRLKGDIYALVDHSFATVGTALNAAESWCDILILH